MKIYITGPCGSGKTTLAKKLSDVVKIAHYCLDDLVFTFSPSKKGKVKFPKEVVSKNINRVLKKENWILEGKHPVIEGFKKCDLIVFMLPPLHTALFRQWSRFIKDKGQRQLFGLKSNLKLSLKIIIQYLAKEDLNQADNLRYCRVGKLIRISNFFADKTMIIKD